MTSALYNERKERIKKAIVFEKTDRTSVVLGNGAFAAPAAGMTVAEFNNDINKSVEAYIKTQEVTGADALDHVNFTAAALSALWLSKVKLPGVDLPENELWQVTEAELMTRDDYDRIINEGWPSFFSYFIQERIGGGTWEKFLEMIENVPSAFEKFKEHDAFPLNFGTLSLPFETFCGGRSMAKFTRDLYQIPDKVQAAMDAAIPDVAKAVLDMGRKVGGFGVWVGGWRAASEFLSPKFWDRFEWPYFEKIVNEVNDAGFVPILHLDSNWERDLARFKELPRQKCIMATDGFTNLYKAREVLGDHMCLMGDVPPAMLSLGTPDEVYKYCRKLIEDLGPTGFILHSGCDVPVNAKMDNVKAMVAAAKG